MERSWVAHYDPGVPAQLDYPSLTLPQLFDASAAENSGRAATIFHGARLTYGQLKGQIDRFAGGLRRLGIVPGDRVAIDLPNLPQFVVAFYGTLRAGAVAVPTNPLYTQHELAYQLADSGARAVVTLDRLFPTLQAALPETRVQTVVVTDVAAALPRHLRLLGRLHQRREGIRRIPSGGIVHRFERVLTSPPAECSATDVDALAVLQYTGGTTGTSKGAMLSHRNMVTNVVQVDAWQGKVRGGSILCGIPFFHVYGLTVAMNIAVVSGATMLLLPRFIPAEAAQMAARYHPGLFPGVPTMYVALAGLSDFSAQQFGSLRACISGAAPLPLEVQRRFLEASGAHVVEGYGLTEAAPVTHCNPVMREAAQRPGSIGVPLPDTDARITSRDGWEPLPAGEIGELTVRGPQVMQGYWNRPDESEAALRDGWLRTGDLAVQDVDGYFRIVDRKKDVIIASGYNVYPREIEEVLLTCPGIRDAAAIGLPDPYRGETVKAVVVRDGPTSEADIIEFCKRELAAYKVPTEVEFLAELPKNLLGKVLRHQLRPVAGAPGS